MMKYVTKIRAKINIRATRKTSNIFDGSYRSVYVGNGLDFENLREYIPGDNIRDIDWKASSRSGKLLTKRYIAEKKHNILLVFDTGKKMLGDTRSLESKKEMALNLGGTIGYLAASNGDSVGAMFNQNSLIMYHPMQSGLENLEEILTGYDKENFAEYTADFEKNLEYIVNHIPRRMIIFLITDAEGIQELSENTLKKLTGRNDVLALEIGDADIADAGLTRQKAFDMEGGFYIPEFISENKQLLKLELEKKAALRAENEKKLLKYRVVSTRIDSEEEMVDKIIELLERHKYANSR